MSNFEKITASPETLSAFLQSLPIANSPWDEEFQKVFCAACDRKDCDEKPCQQQDKRSNPTWWLMQETEGTRDYHKESDCVCVGFSVFLGRKKDKGIPLEGVEKIVFPKVSACERIFPERAELKMIFRSMEYAGAVIRALNEMCTIEIRVAVQHFNRIEGRWDVHRNDYIVEATPKEIELLPLNLFGKNGAEVCFRVNRFSASDGDNEQWSIVWGERGAKSEREKQQ